MKKQFFLLSLLVSVANFMSADSCCDTSCNTSCCDTSCNSCCDTSCCDTSCNSCCDDACMPSHGHTFLSLAPEWGAASPERVALFENHRLNDLKKDDKHGRFQLALFGGQSTKGSQTAAYFLPYGCGCLTFDGSVADTKVGVFASDLAESDALLVTDGGNVLPAAYDELAVGGNYGYHGNQTIAVDPATYKFDLNKDYCKILPWNFGITYAALFEPRGAQADGAVVGTGLITNPTFKSTISPKYKRWHVGAGMELYYHFSDNVDKGWYGRLSTAVEHANVKICLNEKVLEQKIALDQAFLDNADFDSNPFGNAPGEHLGININANSSLFTLDVDATVTDPATGVARVAPVGALKEAYLGYDGTSARDTGFPVDMGGDFPVAPANVTQAFNQSAWKYGKISPCGTKITRLADIELSLGHMWRCGDCASTQWELGLVIPTGNKPCATYVAPAVVGNNQHVGIRIGSTTTVMISEKEESSTWFRVDYDGRYLFKNCQKRSFDLKGNEWSRYMMVWENKDAYAAAMSAMMAGLTDDNLMLPQRSYTPGINVFTAEFNVKPQLQNRINFATMYSGERFRAEIGWNINTRQKECVELECGFNSAPAFADSSDMGGMGLNNNRTIYNDSQTTVVNSIDSLTRGWTLANNPLVAVTHGVQPADSVANNPDFSERYWAATPTVSAENAIAAAVDKYDAFAITCADINLDSVATDAVITHAPYLALGYAFDYECKPVLSLGAKYDFTTTNRGLNQWMVWGKFEVAF